MAVAVMRDRVGARDRAFDKVAPGSYVFEMRSVGLEILRNQLSTYVRLAASGETVLITDRDRVIAEIGPPQAAHGGVLSDAPLAVQRGLVTLRKVTDTKPPPRKPVMPLQQILQDLEHDREDR